MRSSQILWISCTMVVCVSVASAIPRETTDAPVDRLIANAEAYLKEHPDSDRAYYTLARIHYLAFANQALSIDVWDEDGLPRLPPYWFPEVNWYEFQGDQQSRARHQRAITMLLEEHGVATLRDLPKNVDIQQEIRRLEVLLAREGWRPERPSDKALIFHAEKALENFKKAIQIDPNSALYQLGLASLFRVYIEYTDKTSVAEVPASLDTLTWGDAREAFYLAYQLAAEKDSKRTRRSYAGLRGLVSFESGNAFLELSRRMPEISESEKQRMAVVAASLERLKALPVGGPISPIIFTFSEHRSLSDLLATDHAVEFDLDGNGTMERWPWLKPTTALLVWDPEHTGQIRSGRQLFGSATWWVLFEHGYAALDALDDDRDHWLKGAELEGLAGWFDRDGDGVSDAGEVITLSVLGIEAISTICQQSEGVLLNGAGILLKDGTALPTYDWVTQPIGPSPFVPLQAIQPESSVSSALD